MTTSAFATKPVHIDLIRVGDVAEHNGGLRTVGADDLKRGFMGTTLWGDSYRLGTVPVLRAEMVHAKPEAQQ